jgi:Ca2+/Na+ antiporter
MNALVCLSQVSRLRHPQYRKDVLSMLWTIFVVVLVLWLLGFSFHVAGSLIHLLLVVALILLVVNLLSGRSRVL